MKSEKIRASVAKNMFFSSYLFPSFIFGQTNKWLFKFSVVPKRGLSILIAKTQN
ncbi:MAG: hypothetical protein K9G46_00855 [Flavobacteriales bacterium]|jgi:hypothetical protein|nr:hypothetical protein [Flavobacteriales bacterium]